jgi:hypothetical protein
MSTTIKYRIKIEIPRKLTDEEVATVWASITFSPAYTDVDVDDQNGDVRSFLSAYGEESDWSRPHDARHTEVVHAVRKLHADASVESDWLCLDDLPWDSSFCTEGGDEPAET